MKKFLIFIFSLSLILHLTGCKDTTETTATTQTTESFSFTTKAPVIRPDFFPSDIWTYDFECEPLPENVKPEDIVLTLGGPAPNEPCLENGELTYYSLHSAFEVTVKNNASEPIDIYNLIFLERYITPGKTENIEYYNGWKRIPYDYSNYFADKPAQTTLLPGEEIVLTFYNDINVRDLFLGDPNAQGSFLGDFEFYPGRYRLAVYMDGGVRYVEFPLIRRRQN